MLSAAVAKQTANVSLMRLSVSRGETSMFLSVERGTECHIRSRKKVHTVSAEYCGTMSGSSAASGAGSGRYASHEGVHAGVDTSYQPMREQHHDTHAEAMAARAEHPSVKRRGIEPMTDVLAPGEKVLFPLNDGLHRGVVVADVCTLGELYEGNLHVRASGAKGESSDL